MSEYKIDEQEWKSWPKAVMMRRDWTTNGHDHRKEVRRYVPDDESETLRREVNRLRSAIKCLESRLRDSYRSDSRLDKWAERLRGRIHDIARDRDKLTAENAKLLELVRKQDALTKAVYAYLAGGERSLDDFNVMMNANAQVLILKRELGIEVEDV